MEQSDKVRNAQRRNQLFFWGGGGKHKQGLPKIIKPKRYLEAGHSPNHYSHNSALRHLRTSDQRVLILLCDAVVFLVNCHQFKTTLLKLNRVLLCEKRN